MKREIQFSVVLDNLKDTDMTFISQFPSNWCLKSKHLDSFVLSFYSSCYIEYEMID